MSRAADDASCDLQVRTASLKRVLTRAARRQPVCDRPLAYANAILTRVVAARRGPQGTGRRYALASASAYSFQR
jgi:hypothetical protein